MNQLTCYIKALLFYGILCLSLNSIAQSPSHLIHFIITGPYSTQQAQNLDSHLEVVPGLELKRVDFNTRNVFLIVQGDSLMTEDYFSELLAQLDLTFNCFQSALFQNQPLIPIPSRNCQHAEADSNVTDLTSAKANGPCCTGHGLTGCLNLACQTAICNLDAFCCTSSWDAICANAAINNANSGGACAGVSDCPGGSGGGGNGPCCTSNGSPGCENASCEAAICALDAFCCTNTWDAVCAGAAVNNANAAGVCAGVSDCPGGGSGGQPCCSPSASGTPGCEWAACQAAVCAIDNFCCTFQWDLICSNLANDDALAGGACSGISNCPTGNTGGPITAGDCVNSINVCTNLTFSVDPNGFGTTNEICNCCTSNPCVNPVSTNSGCLLAGELNSTWMIINIQTSGVLEFSFGNLVGFNCYDWIMYPYDSNTCTNILNNTATPIRCNWNAPCQSFTGVGLPPPPGGNAGNFEPALNVSAGDQYLVCFSNYSSAVTLVPLQFGGTAGVSCTPLPVELISFSGKEHSGNALLNWQTATETNNDFFSLERSHDGVSWETIANINGSGYSSSPLSYSYLDMNLIPGVYYYRLYQQDHEGSVMQIGELALTIAGSPWTLFPNPTTNHWNILAPNISSDLQVELRNASGQLVPVQNTTSDKAITIRLQEHVPGFYFLRIMNADGLNIYSTRVVAY